MLAGAPAADWVHASRLDAGVQGGLTAVGICQAATVLHPVGVGDVRSELVPDLFVGPGVWLRPCWAGEEHGFTASIMGCSPRAASSSLTSLSNAHLAQL